VKKKKTSMCFSVRFIQESNLKAYTCDQLDHLGRRETLLCELRGVVLEGLMGLWHSSRTSFRRIDSASSEGDLGDVARKELAQYLTVCEHVMCNLPLLDSEHRRQSDNVGERGKPTWHLKVVEDLESVVEGIANVLSSRLSNDHRTLLQ
jgi:hypothetical protein